MTARKEDNPFSQQEMFLGGEKDLKDEVHLMGAALLKKDGLVDKDKQEALRRQISDAFSEDVLEQLSETVSATTDNDPIQKPRKEAVIMSKFDLELFQTNQGEAPAVIGQQDVDRNYILAL